LSSLQSYGSVAQSVEQRTENPRVGGSIPSRTTIITFGLVHTRNLTAMRFTLEEVQGSDARVQAIPSRTTI
jgi:hypothetical protein